MCLRKRMSPKEMIASASLLVQMGAHVRALARSTKGCRDKSTIGILERGTPERLATEERLASPSQFKDPTNVPSFGVISK